MEDVVAVAVFEAAFEEGPDGAAAPAADAGAAVLPFRS